MEVDDAFISTVKFWAKRLTRFGKSYNIEDVLNIDELGLFFKLLPDNRLIEKTKSKKGEKKSKVR